MIDAHRVLVAVIKKVLDEESVHYLDDFDLDILTTIDGARLTEEEIAAVVKARDEAETIYRQERRPRGRPRV